MDVELLQELVEAYPAQPATAFWRAAELGALIIHGLPHGRGLDLGCGDGKLTAILLGRVGPRLFTGVDVDPLEVSAARRFDFYERVHAVSGARVPEPDASFDFVLSNSVLEHIPDLPPVLGEAARVLRPSGRFLFTVPGRGFHRCLRGSLLPWVGRQSYLDRLDRRLAHHRYPDSREWARLLEAVGLELDEAVPYFDGAEVRRWEAIHRMTAGVVDALLFGAVRPIRVQRLTGLRALQNRRRLPASLAAPLSRVLSRGMTAQLGPPQGLGEAEAGGLLLIGGRR